MCFASYFVIYFVAEHEVLCSKNNETSGQGFSYANFVRDPFHYLNATKVESSLVQDVDACSFACLGHPSCVSVNVAAQPVDIIGHLLCELLASAK